MTRYVILWYFTLVFVDFVAGYHGRKSHAMKTYVDMWTPRPPTMLSCFDNHPTIVDGVITGIDRNLMNDGKHHAHRNKTALNQAKGHAMCDNLLC